METPDKDSISDDIQEIGDHRNCHGQSAVSLCPVNGCTGIIQSNKRKRQCCIIKVDHSSIHNIRFYLSKDKVQKLPVTDHAKYRDHCRDKKHNKQHLLSCPFRFLWLFLPDILGTNDTASCCKCGEGLDYQYIDRIHQGNR